MDFSVADQRHLEAAEGWLGLGDHIEAQKELDAITPELHGHPLILNLRWQVCAAGKKWKAALDIAASMTRTAPNDPQGWVHQSYALHELKRTQEALDALMCVVHRFPKVAIMRYNLACYECQLGHVTEAKAWLKMAFVLAEDARQMRQMALEDPDLGPLRKEVASMALE
jgi:predicted Zn-dependent protease